MQSERNHLEGDAPFARFLAAPTHGKRRPRHRAGKRKQGTFEISFANITEMSPKANHWLQFNTSDAWVAVETHWEPRAEPLGRQRIRDFAQAGWQTITGPPQRSLTSSTGTYGGVLAGIRNHLAFVPGAGARRLPEIRASTWWAENPYLVGFQIGMQGFDFLVFGTYHRGGVNIELLSEISKATHRGRVPFLLAGDFNDTSDVLERTGWLEAVGARIVGPYEGTCKGSQGSCRCIDMCIISECLAPLVMDVQIDWQVPFA